MDEKRYAEPKHSLVQAKAIRAGQLEGRRTNMIDVKAVRERELGMLIAEADVLTGSSRRFEFIYGL